MPAPPGSDAPAPDRYGGPARSRGRARPSRGARRVDSAASRAQALRHRLGRLRRDGQAAAGLGHRVVAGLDRVQHGHAGHHVVHQLVRRDAEAVQRLALPADVGDVGGGQQRRDLRLRARRRTGALGERLVGRTRCAQPRLLVAVADQHEGEGFGRAARRPHRAARPARWARHASRRRPPPGARRRAAARCAWRWPAASEAAAPCHSSGEMPLGTMCSLRRSSPCAFR